MSSSRCLLVALALIISSSNSVSFHAINSRTSPYDTGSSITPLHPSVFNRALSSPQQHSLSSANNPNPTRCSALKLTMEEQPLADDYLLCRSMLHRASCDGKPYPAPVLLRKVSCVLPKQLEQIQFQCPGGGTSQRLPLFASNITLHYHEDGKTCDFDVKARAFCDGVCIVAGSESGRSNCMAPQIGDLVLTVERC